MSRGIVSVGFKGSRSGEFFEHKLFENGDKYSQVSLVFGRNGAGKSTFAKDLKKNLEENSAKLTTYPARSAGHEEITPFLFNESVFDRMVFKHGEGENGYLETIVLFDKEVQDQEEIEAHESTLESLVAQIKSNELRIFEIGDAQPGEISETKNSLRKALKGEGSWIDYERKAKGLERAPQVTENRLTEVRNAFGKSNEEKRADVSEDALRDERNSLLAKLESSRGREAVSIDLPCFQEIWNLDELQDLLNEVPEIHPTADYDQHYIDLLKSELKEVPNAARTHFLKNDVDCCPMCTQSIDAELLKALRGALTRVFDGDGRKELAAKIGVATGARPGDPHALSDEQTKVLETNTVHGFENACRALSKSNLQILDSVDQKLKALEQKVSLPIDARKAALQEYRHAHEQCLKELHHFNDEVSKHEKTLSRFHEVNLEIALRNQEVFTSVTRWNELETEKDKCNRELANQRRERRELNSKINQLKAKQENLSAAVDLVNSYMRVVFADSDRLQLQPVGKAYRVLSRGTGVSLDDLSTGERNIIGLAYFLAEMFRGTDDHVDYRGNRFIIMDDPLSSFDNDNRYGVFLLLKQIIDKFVENSETQIVILSHDLKLIQDMEDILKTSDRARTTTCEIADHRVEPVELSGFSSYGLGLKKIYDFACSEDIRALPLSEIPTGNEMRVVLEAFAEFEASVGIADLPKSKVISNRMEKISLALDSYFNSPLYKLLLHGESHSAN